ncbi:hypothetical protein [Aestuariimicrobium sp. Y1814]|uniref:DUF7919 family protein n=1 Tax=Aestuariimicrobium sp. Y1814 TaxID=3418742 RepID=UPI003DA76E99
MTHQDDGADLSPSLYSPVRGLARWRARPPLAFGWLEPGHPYRRGQAPVAVLVALEQLALAPVDQTRGYHGCGFCRHPGLSGTPYRTLHGHDLLLGSASIAATIEGRRWVAPNLVLHYLTSHDYLPPAEVVAGLEASPPRP